jgi:hypothetical protein
MNILEFSLFCSIVSEYPCIFVTLKEEKNPFTLFHWPLFLTAAHLQPFTPALFSVSVTVIKITNFSTFALKDQ